jgi:hypothetical protein
LIPEAHFTLTELPGTIAIWASGIALGLALGARRLRTALGPLVLMAALAGLAMLGDTYRWPEALKFATDAVFLVAAIAAAAVLWRGFDARGHRYGQSRG